MPDLILKHLKPIFAILVLLGIAVILGFTLLQGPYSPSRHWVMIGIVVSLMLFYGAVVWLRSKTQYSTADDADTFYYLGSLVSDTFHSKFSWLGSALRFSAIAESVRS